MLLAAGLGNRMRPLTANHPKPVLPVLGRPMLLQILERLSGSGVESVVVNLHHLPEQVRRALDGAPPGLKIRTSLEREIQGTAGALRDSAAHLRGGGPILIHNSDFLSDIDFAALVDRHRRSGLPATLVLAGSRPEYAVVETDRDGRVVSLAGRPACDPATVEGRFLFTGCHVIDPSVLDLIPGGGPSHIVRDVYEKLAASGKLGSFRHSGFWWEFGTPETYLEGSLRLLRLAGKSLREIAAVDPRRSLGDAIAAVGEGAEVDDGAVFRGRVAIGSRARVEPECVIEDAVLMPGARIGRGSRVVRAVVGTGAELPAGFRAESVVLAADADPQSTLPAEIRREAGLLIRKLSGKGG